MRHSVSPKDLERELAEGRRRVKASGLPRLLDAADPGAFGTTPLNLELLDAVAHAWAAASAAAAEDANALGLAYLMAEEAADRVAPLGERAEPPPEASLPPKEYRDFPKAAPLGVPDLVLADAARFLRFYAEHPDGAKRLRRDREAAGCLFSYFRLLSRALRKVGPEILPFEAETPRLKLDGWRVRPASAEEPHGLLDVAVEDVVGNEDYLKRARRLARDVAGFDLARGENPKKVRNPVLFVLGAPGCGKTVAAHAVGREFLALCEKAGLPARFRVIRRTDWASAYQNQSANRLLEIFKEEVFNAPGVCGVYWPDIDTAFAARSDADIRQEEKNILGTLFGILDGTVGPKNGRWFMICDANTLHMDEATMSRLSQAPLRALGPVSPADFVRLLRDIKLKGKGRWLPIDEAGWTRIGEALVARKLSGRSVANLSGRILTEIEDFDEPEEYFAAGFERKLELIAELSRSVDAARILAMIDEYARFEKEAEDLAETKRFDDRVREIRFHLSTQRAALSLPPAPDAPPEG